MVTLAELNSNFYPEILNEITRHDHSLAKGCILSAEAEAKSYLSKYDLDTLFAGTLGDDIVGHLKTTIKDIASWHLVRLANPNIDLKLFRTNYEDAIKWLKAVQSGQTDPKGWPYPKDDTGSHEAIQWSSNRKRDQFF